MQSLVRRYTWPKRCRRCFSAGDSKHPVLTCFAKAAGIQASNLRSAESTQQSKPTRLDTVLSHVGLPIASDANPPLIPPIHLSSTYMRPPSGDYGPEGLVYTRIHNPTRLLFEQTMTTLETRHSNELKDTNTTPTNNSSFAFASGMAAVSSLIMASQSPVHVILPDDVYWGTPNVLLSVFRSQEIQTHHSFPDTTTSFSSLTHSIVDMTCTEKLEERITQVLQTQSPMKTKTILIWMETPSNPQCKVIDIQQICNKVHQIKQSNPDEVNIITVVDSTLAPPNITQPLLVCKQSWKECI